MSLPQRPMRFFQQWALAAVLSVVLHLSLAAAFVFWPEGDEGEGADGLAGAAPYLNQAVAVQFVSLASVASFHSAVPEVAESKPEAVVELKPEPPTLSVVQEAKKPTRTLPVIPKSAQKEVSEKAPRSTKVEQPVKVAPPIYKPKPEAQLKPKSQSQIQQKQTSESTPKPESKPKATPKLVKTPESKPKLSVEKPATVDPTIKKELEEELAEQPTSLLEKSTSEQSPEPSIDVAPMPQATVATSQVDNKNQPDSVKTTATSKASSSALSPNANQSSNESANQSSNQSANQSPSLQVASTTGSTGSAGLISPQYTHKPIKYPSRARERGQEGKLEVSVSVSALGKVTKVVLLSSSGHVLLDKAALKAVKRWRFKSATHHGQAVAATVVVPYEFRLQ